MPSFIERLMFWRKPKSTNEPESLGTNSNGNRPSRRTDDHPQSSGTTSDRRSKRSSASSESLGTVSDRRGGPKDQRALPTTYASNSSIVAPDVPDFGGARTSQASFTLGGGGTSALPKRAASELQLDASTLESSSLEDLIDILIDAHPDLGYALWNFLRIGNSNYKYSVMKVGSDKEDTASKKIIDQFIQMLEMPNINQFQSSRSLKKVINQLMLSVLTRGAGSLEVVLGDSFAGASFLAPVDPATITFQFQGDRYVPYQDTDKISLDIPSFFYEALDEKIDDPYGRSPFTNAVQMVLFQLQVLQDIKAVVHNQGYPRFDIKILEEVLLQRMPISIRNNEEKKAQWLAAKLKEVIDMYNGLQPDDTFVHFDSIEMATVGGKSGGGGALIDPEKLMTVIDNLVMSGLKTLSTILGRRSTGNTESFAKIEIKLYLQGVKAIQDVVARLISRALTLVLNLNGKQGIVHFEFEPIEIRTELEQEQFLQIKLQNIAYMRDQGWIDQDMASIRAVGTPSVAEPNMDMLGKGRAGSATTSDGSTPQGATRTSGGS